MLQQTFDQLRELRLGGCAAALKEQLENPKYQQLSFDERLALIVEREHLLRHNRRLSRNLRLAKLKQRATVEELDFERSRGLKRSQVMELAGGAWIEHKQNLFILGPTGVGKTYLACALANRAVQSGSHAFYSKTSDLLADVAIARADGSYGKLAVKLSRLALLILDDRYNNASTLLVSQLPVEHWHENFPDPTIADAVLDRLVHNAHRITLRGESMRKINAASAEGLTAGASLRSDNKSKNKED